MNVSSTVRRKTVALAAATAIALGVLGVLLTSGSAAEAAPAQPTKQEINRDLAAARAASARYHRVEAAIADGFVDTQHCVMSPDGSAAMGIHFVNLARMLDGRLDVSEPEVLLYAKDDRGRYRLIGVEYLGGQSDVLFGEQFRPGGPTGHALHVWLWKHNPSGMFADFNPNVSC